MGRGKKIYCAVSIAIGILALTTFFVIAHSSEVYATSTQSSILNTDETPITTTDSDATGTGFNISYNNGEGELSGALKILLVLTVISLAPSILVMLTSFTRIVIVLHFVRQALGTTTVPPNQVIVGLALFLTVFIMSPIFTEINENAIKPLDEGEITQEEALEIGMEPLRVFMYGQTQVKDLNLLLEISGNEDAASADDVPMSVLIPSFILSELRSAFIMGFLIYIPFIIIDMVVASILMSMGMMMLPPTTISMPFKILLFILADGWDLVVGNLVKTFY